jgi:hypothetical protein
VTEQNLNGAEIGTRFQHMGGTRVPQDVLVMLMIRIPRRFAIAITRITE